MALQWALEISELGSVPDERHDEAALVARAKTDRRAFDALYRRHVSGIYRYCYRRLGSVPAAEDVTQQVFMTAIAKLTNCRDESFRGWLYTIARNETINWLRQNQVSIQFEAVPEQPHPGASPEDRAVAADVNERVTGAMKRLKREQREVIELKFSGLTTAETARILKVSEGAVKQLQHRGLVRLRALLGFDVM